MFDIKAPIWVICPFLLQFLHQIVLFNSLFSAALGREVDFVELVVTFKNLRFGQNVRNNNNNFNTGKTRQRDQCSIIQCPNFPWISQTYRKSGHSQYLGSKIWLAFPKLRIKSSPDQFYEFYHNAMQDNRQNSRTAHTYAILRHFQTINAGQCLAENQHPLFANQI